MPPVVAVLLWKFFYNGSPTGVFNTILGWVGLGPYPWLQDASTAMPSLVLAATWAGAALRTADGRLDGIQLDVEPWTLPGWRDDRDDGVRRWLAVLDATRAVVPNALTLGADAPWWLVNVPAPDEGGSVLDAVLRRVDRVVVVAFSDHADGDDGIVALARPSVETARAAGVPWTIGVETDTPDVAGGAQYTFHDEGAAVLEREADRVARAFGAPGCVCVEHHRAWRALLDLDDDAPYTSNT